MSGYGTLQDFRSLQTRFLLNPAPAPPPRAPLPVLRGAKKAAALKARAWMMTFLDEAMKPEARHARQEIETFGNQKQSKHFAAIQYLIWRGSVLKVSTPRNPDRLLSQWELEARSELGTWLADTITRNRTRELETLVKVLRARRAPRKQTLKSCILRCLDELILKAGGPQGGFTVTVTCTYGFLTAVEAETARDPGSMTEMEILAAWWNETGGPHLLPRHLPTMKALEDATEAQYTEKVLTQFSKEFRRTCKALGLSALP